MMLKCPNCSGEYAGGDAECPTCKALLRGAARKAPDTWCALEFNFSRLTLSVFFPYLFILLLILLKVHFLLNFAVFIASSAFIHYIYRKRFLGALLSFFGKQSEAYKIISEAITYRGVLFAFYSLNREKLDQIRERDTKVMLAISYAERFTGYGWSGAFLGLVVLGMVMSANILLR